MIRFGCEGQFLRGRIWEGGQQGLPSIFVRVEIELLILHATSLQCHRPFQLRDGFFAPNVKNDKLVVSVPTRFEGLKHCSILKSSLHGERSSSSAHLALDYHTICHSVFTYLLLTLRKEHQLPKRRVLNEGSPCLKPCSNFHPLNSRVKAIVTSQKWMVYWLSLIRKKASYGINFNPYCSEANKIPYDLKRADPEYIKGLAFAFNNHFCWRIHGAGLNVDWGESARKVPPPSRTEKSSVNLNSKSFAGYVFMHPKRVKKLE
ncbi:hypothetical protein NC652_018512 [Populus alba x Populus x berolinensis]|nr:hypothetical protein NC652_018512 [Populus alba x Populus x berolinensis]